MEAKTTFLHLFERLEGFVGKLPGSLQKPILQEIVPLKDLFLRQRAPRLVVTGDPAAGSAGLFNAIFSAPVAPFAQAATADVVPPAAGWQDFSHLGRGVLRLLDARQAAPGADRGRCDASGVDDAAGRPVRVSPGVPGDSGDTGD